MSARTRTLPALTALLALLLLTVVACSGDGDGSASDDSQAPATTETSAVFDPDASGADPDDPDTSVTPDGPEDPDECVVDPEEGNTATVVRDYLECVDPALAEDVNGAASDSTVVDVSGPIDPDDAVEICEIVSDFVYSVELDGPDSERAVTVSRDSDVLGESAEVLVVRTSPDNECEPA